MTNEEKQMLKRICKSSISKHAVKNKVDFFLLDVSESTINKYWRIFGAKDVNIKKERESIK